MKDFLLGTALFLLMTLFWTFSHLNGFIYLAALIETFAFIGFISIHLTNLLTDLDQYVRNK